MLKRGIMFVEIPMWILRLMFMIIVLFSIVLIVNYFVVSELNIQDGLSYIAINAITYSPEGLAYHDDVVDRTYYKISERKLRHPDEADVFDDLDGSPATADGFMWGHPNIVAMRLFKEYQHWGNTDRESNNMFGKANTTMYNQLTFDRWNVIIQAKIGGPSAPSMLIDNNTMVMVYNESVRYSWPMQYEVATSNT